MYIRMQMQNSVFVATWKSDYQSFFFVNKHGATGLDPNVFLNLPTLLYIFVVIHGTRKRAIVQTPGKVWKTKNKAYPIDDHKSVHYLPCLALERVWT